MKRNICLFLLVISSTVQGENQPDDLYREAAIFARYNGVYRLIGDQREKNISPEPLLIQSQQEFEAFAAKFPVQENSKFGQYKLNLTLLTRTPRFDWDRLMMLVVFDEYSFAFPPNIVRIEVHSNQLLAVVEYPAIAYDLMSISQAKPLDSGAYSAVLVAKNSLSLQWRLPEKPTSHKKNHYRMSR